MTVPVGLRQRIPYYWAKLYTEQLQAGEDYRLLKPTISVCFVDGVVFEDSPDYHLAFKLINAERNITLTDDLAIHFFELPKFNLTAEQLRTPMEARLYFLRHADRLTPGHLPGSLDTDVIRQAMEVLMRLTQVDTQKEIYEGRIKARRDAQTMLNALTEARSEAAEARSEAAEAMEKGMLIGRIGLLQKLVQRDVTPPAELEAMSLKSLASLAAQLEGELPA